MRNCLKVIRAQYGISQEQLAINVNTTRQTIIALEKGETKKPDGNLLIKIANYFNKDPREIFFIDDVNHTKRSI